jgi:hypothetical protein
MNGYEVWEIMLSVHLGIAQHKSIIGLFDPLDGTIEPFSSWDLEIQIVDVLSVSFGGSLV